MDSKEILNILAGLLRRDVVYRLNDLCIEVPEENPIDDNNTSFYRYKVVEDKIILVEQWLDGNLKRFAKKSLQDFVWNHCKLGHVCTKYEKQYDEWKWENGGIPYLETNIIDELDGRSERSYEFIRNFWGNIFSNDEEYQNLRFILAEYGVGKSSYCQGIRNLVAKEIKGVFLEGHAAFPFVFDLQEYRSGDIEKFIETELFNKYDVTINYQIFKMLCQNGIFMVVLDAWDQLRSARKIFYDDLNLRLICNLWEKQGKALITCRWSFYQQQLKDKGMGKNDLFQNARLYKLTEFDKGSVLEYFRFDSKARERKGSKDLIQDVVAWVEKSWELNRELLVKPLNLKLLFKHFDMLSQRIDFFCEKVDTYLFLKIVMEDWKKKCHVEDDSFLKKLVSLTLYFGLNRSISLYQFQEACDADKWDEIMECLQSFDFVRINEKEERIEFCLAVFQEFLWAHFALEELKMPPENRDIDPLIKTYLLSWEARGWICKELRDEKSDCLVKNLNSIKMELREEAGYCGTNALTLLCDLNKIICYKEQFNHIRFNLRHSPLMGTDFRGIDLSGADFYDSDLKGADFSYTKLDRVCFCYADLEKTKWREHEMMTKCAFLIQSDELCVVVAMKSGGLFIYQIKNRMQRIVDLQNEVINDLVGNSSGIYMTSSGGLVGYMDKDGHLSNSYVAESGLQSITYTNDRSYVYVATNNQGFFRYNWHTGRKQEIEIDQPLGDGTDMISDIHYCSDMDKEDYIAYLISDRHLLVLLKVEGKNKAKVRAKCRIDTERYCFGNICFVNDMLIYTVIGKGIYGMMVDEVIDEIPEREILDERQKLLSLPQAETILLSWANESSVLMVVSMSEGKSPEHLHVIDLSSGVPICIQIEIDWLWKERNYCMEMERVCGFSVSGDGSYVAFSGNFLAIFKIERECYSLIDRPIETKITCKDADFSNCKGMDNTLKRFVEDRGAKF